MPKTPKLRNATERMEFILGELEKDPTPGKQQSAASETEALEAQPEATDEGEVSPHEVETALAKLDSAKAEKAEAKAGAEDTPPPDPQKESDGEAEPETPALDPPKFWNAEARERFRLLSPQLQTYVLEQEENAHKARSKSINDAAEFRKAAEIERSQAGQQAQQLAQASVQVAQYLNSLVEQTRQTDPVLAQWNSIADKVKFATDNPQEYSRLHAAVQQRTEQLQAWERQRDQASQQAAQAQTAARETYLADQNRRLFDKIPEWREDASKARSGFDEVLSFAQSKYQVTPREIHNVGDHRLVLVLRDAMMKDRQIESLLAENAKLKVQKETTQARVAEKKVAPPAPRVAMPKAADEEQGTNTQRKRSVLNQARKTISDRNRADLVASVLE